MKHKKIKPNIIARLFGITSAPQIHPYRGFGSKKQVTVLGRVTTSSPETKPLRRLSGFSHVIEMIRSYLAQPLPGMQVLVTYKEQTQQAVTNKGGVFSVTITTDDQGVSEHTESPALITLDTHPEISTTTTVHITDSSNTYGVISDIDDTVLVSNATQKLQLLYATIFKSPERRQAFVGVAALYQAFITGESGKNTNPIFYVSSSHWNIYAFLTRFLKINTIPAGPVLLKETEGFLSMLSSVGNHSQKVTHIISILEAYPQMQFILIGDSGQKDAALYIEIASEFPNRIKMIYIRDVTLDTDHLFEATNKNSMLLAKSSTDMAEHAYNQGYITKESLQTVSAAVEKDI